MDEKRLNHFLAAAEAETFGQAADAIGLSNQGLSQSIAALEQNLGFRLFDRGQFGARLTSYGTAFVPHAKLILSQGRSALSELKAIQSGQSGAISLGGGVSFMAEIIPLALSRFLEKHPHVEISASTEDWDQLVAGLRLGGYDFLASALGETAYDESDIAMEILFEQRFALFASAHHPLARSQSLTLEDVQPFPWIMNEGENKASNIVQRSFLNAGLAQPRLVLYTRLESIFTRRIIQLGDYVVHGSTNFFTQEHQDGTIVELDLPELVARRPAGIVVRKDHPMSPSAQALIDEIRSICAPLKEGGTIPSI